MQRSIAMRLLASFAAVWFAFVTIQPLYGDPCPHHQPALAALAQGLATGSGNSHTMGAQGDMAAGMDHGTHGAAGHDGPHGSHQCHCLGACCGVAPVAFAQPRIEWVPIAVATRIRLSSSTRRVTVPRAPQPHTLPFSTAPPPALLA